MNEDILKLLKTILVIGNYRVFMKRHLVVDMNVNLRSFKEDIMNNFDTCKAFVAGAKYGKGSNLFLRKRKFSFSKY